MTSHAQVVWCLYSLRYLYPGDDMFIVVPNWRSIKSPQSTVEEDVLNIIFVRLLNALFMPLSLLNILPVSQQHNYWLLKNSNISSMEKTFQMKCNIVLVVQRLWRSPGMWKTGVQSPMEILKNFNPTWHWWSIAKPEVMTHFFLGELNMTVFHDNHPECERPGFDSPLRHQNFLIHCNINLVCLNDVHTSCIKEASVINFLYFAEFCPALRCCQTRRTFAFTTVVWIFVTTIIAGWWIFRVTSICRNQKRNFLFWII